MEKFSFRTKWIDSEEKFCATMYCNGKEIETQEFYGHQDMMLWISETMAEYLLCGEDWIFQIN